MQYAEMRAKNIIPKYKKRIAEKIRESVLQQQTNKVHHLISEGQRVDSGLGSIILDIGKELVARDRYGNKVTEALMLYYHSNKEITVQDKWNAHGTDAAAPTYKTKTVCFYDTIAQATAKSAKNIVLTTVQGRDYTRKELVSGGDVSFSVSGKIVSHDDGVYPDNEVKKFIQVDRKSVV